MEIRSLLKSQSAQARLRGASPRHIDHVNLWCGQTQPDDTIAWMSEHLGFKVCEYIQLPDLKLGAWMSVTSPSCSTAQTRERDSITSPIGLIRRKTSYMRSATSPSKAFAPI